MDRREQLKQIREESGKSFAVIAKSMGISSATLSQWLDGAYAGNVQRIDDAVDSYIQNWRDKAALAKIDVRFCDTMNARKVESLCRIALHDHKLVVLTGDSGCGKTAALKRFADRTAGTIYLEVDPTFNPKRLFAQIAKALGRPVNGLLEDLYEGCIAALQKTDRVIIVDQAELLSVKALELLRCLYDKAGVGILLAGMPRLIENIRGMRNEFAQIYTRIGSSMRLDPISIDDAMLIIKTQLPSASEHTATFYTESRKNCRTLSMLLFNAVRVSSKQQIAISDELIRKCARVLEV